MVAIANYAVDTKIVLDTSGVFPSTIDHLGKRFNGGIGGLARLNESEFQPFFDSLDFVLGLPNLIVIEEVVNDLSGILAKLNRTSEFARKYLNGNIPRNGHTIRDRDEMDTDIPEKVEENLEILDVYNRHLASAIHRFSHDKDPRDNFNDKQRILYMVSKKHAMTAKAVVFGKNNILNNTRNTDIELISTSNAYTYDEPVILLTSNGGLATRAEGMLEFVRDVETTRKLNGGSFVIPKHPVIPTDYVNLPDYIPGIES